MLLQSQTLDLYDQHRILTVNRDLAHGVVEVTTNQGGPFVFRPTELLRWPRRLDGSTRHHPGPVNPEELAIGDTIPIADDPLKGLWTVAGLQPTHPFGSAILVVTHNLFGTRGVKVPFGLPVRPIFMSGEPSEYRLQNDGLPTYRRPPASTPAPDWYQGFGPYLVPGAGENPLYDVELPPGEARDHAELWHLVMMADRDGRGRWPLPFRFPGDEWSTAGLNNDVVYRRPPQKWDFDEPARFVGPQHLRHPRDPREGFGWQMNDQVNGMADRLLEAYNAYTSQVYKWRHRDQAVPVAPPPAVD